MHIGTVAERIQGASRRVRLRFEPRLGHLLSRTQICSELDGTPRNQLRTPLFKKNYFNRIFALIWFSLEPKTGKNVKNRQKEQFVSRTNTGHLAACYELFS